MVEVVRRIQTAILLMVVFLIPTIFWRIAIDPFDLMKGSFLWILGIPLFFLGLARILQEKRIGAPILLVVPAGILFAALVLTTVTSMEIRTSVFGQTQRYTGLLTLSACLMVAMLIARGSTGENFDRVFWAHAGAAVIVAGYGLIQEVEADPFEWSASSFVKLVFATLGNPNTATAWLGTSIPLLYGAFLYSAQRSIAWRVPWAVLLGLSSYLIVAFQSFQGQIAVLFLLPVAVVWIVSRERSIGDLAGVVLSLGVGLIVPQISSGGSLLILSIVAMVLASLCFGTTRFMVLNKRVSLTTLSRGKKIGTGAALAVLAALVGFVFREVLTRGLKDGFIERGDFFRSARDVWMDNPILGTGLETFGFVFSEYRPASHAIRLDDSRTSSVHNIFLGMFSNGGLILGLAFLAFTVCTGFAAWKVLKSEARRDIRVVGVIFGWLAFQVVSVVSVEHVALFLLNFVFTGLIFSQLPRSSKLSVSKKAIPQRSRGSRHRNRLTTSAAIALIVMIPGTILGWYQVSRPMRAGVAGFEGLQAFYQQGGNARVLGEMEKATEIAPWDATNWLRLAEVAAETGNYAVAAPAARRALETSFYIGGAAKSASRILFNAGAVDESIEVTREALRRDPYSPGMKTSLAEMLIYGAQYYYSSNDLETARALLVESQELLPGYSIEGLDDLLASVGLVG